MTPQRPTLIELDRQSLPHAVYGYDAADAVTSVEYPRLGVTTTIDIIDQTGRVVMTPVIEPMLQSGACTRSVDVSPLPVGPYLLIPRSPNGILHARMDVVR